MGLSVCLSVCLSVYRPSVHSSIYTYVHTFISTSICPYVFPPNIDGFKCGIIRYPDHSGNIPTNPAYGVFTSQVIWYARICSRKGELIERFKSLTKNYCANTTPSMVSRHNWRNIWRNIAGSLSDWAQDFTRTSQKNNYQHCDNFGPTWQQHDQSSMICHFIPISKWQLSWKPLLLSP